MSLHRTRADWPIVAAAWLIVLLAATLLAAGPIYSSAVSLAGLHRVLEDADVTQANVEVTARVDVPEATAVLDKVSNELRQGAGSVPMDVVAAGRSDSFALPDQPAEAVRDLVTIGFLDGVEQHATLVSGSWPATVRGSDMQLAVGEQIAQALSLRVGQPMELVSRLDPSLAIGVVVVGVYRPTDPNDPYWWSDPSLLEGITESAQYRTFGPLLTTREELLLRAVGETVALTWHAYPHFEQLTIDQIGPLRAAFEQLPETIAAAAPDGFPVVRTNLGEILAASERSLLVSRTGILLLMAQLAILAGYAIVLTAALIVDHRRLDTALLRSRGAGPAQIGGLALAEGLLLAIPAGLAGPWLAAGALRILNLAGPLAGIGLAIEPRVTGDAYFAAVAAAVGCALLLVLPALLSARSFAAEQAGRSRNETRTLGQRLGLDIALLSVTVVAIWQLRLYGAPLTKTVHGVLGLDPLLVAAPAIGLLAGGVVALRLLPLLAQGAESVLAGGRDLVGSLGARQLARRPLRYTRAALLLMLAMSMGVFAVSYASTWVGSQRDQAQFQVGADVRVAPARGPSAMPAWALASAFGSIDGVGQTMPVERQRLQVRADASSGELLGIDADVAKDVVSIRADLSGGSFASLAGALVDARPSVAAIPISGQPQRLRLTFDLEIAELHGFFFDPVTGEGSQQHIDPATLDGQAILAGTLFVRDAGGLIHRFEAQPFAPVGGVGEVVVPLAAATADSRANVASSRATLSYPVEVVGVDLVVSLPGQVEVGSGTIGLRDLAASDAAEGEDWRPLDMAAGGEWEVGRSQGPGGTILLAPAGTVVERAVTLGSSEAFSSLGGVDQNGNGVTISFLPEQVQGLATADLPALVNGAFLSQNAAHLGDRISVPLEGGDRNLRIVGSIGSFPTTEPGRPLAVVDLATLDLIRFQAAHATRQPTEWWLQADDRAATAALEPAESGPFARATVISRLDRTASLSADPLALGIIGALALGFVVAGLFAVIGLAASAAVSARQRRGEFALLRALGLSGGQLSGWLWLENASLVVVSLLAGTALGLLIGWVALPYITVTQQAASPFPPVIVETPWTTIAILEAVSSGALALTVIGLATVLRRSGVGSVLRMGGD